MNAVEAQKPAAIMLMGPTASGKTALAKLLCDRYPCDIINVDSAQFYRDMDIGSAKPDLDELAQYPHRMLSFLDPSETYSMAQFQKDILEEINSILAAGRTPLLVGGSMMYFKVLLEGMSDLPNTDVQLRKRLENIKNKKGLAYLYRWLAKLDSDTAQRLHENDTQRILRALEVCLISGSTMTALFDAGKQAPDFPCRWVQFILFPERRDLLHKQIERRYIQMVENGFVAEVERLYARQDLQRELPALRAVGYKQVWAYLEGELSYANMLERGIIATRQFAKRQYTWLRSWKDAYFFDSSPMLANDASAVKKAKSDWLDEVSKYL